MPIRKMNEIMLWQSDLLSREGITHGFTCRMGGVSKGAYASLSMSPRRGDDLSNVRKNEEILCLAANLCRENLTSTNQLHTDEVEIIDEKNIGMGIRFPWSKGVDAIITRQREVPLLAYAADCTPLLMYAADIKAAAAVHSGWRGTEMKIAAKTAQRLMDMGAGAENILVAVGPAIGGCCYEVGGEVALRFPENVRTEKSGGKYMLDLKKANELMLREMGIESIDNSAPCTMCGNDMFFSHRGQGGKSGTLGAFIQL